MKIIAVIIAVIAVIYVIAKRNGFEAKRQAIKTEAANIGIYINKRSEYLSDALNTLKVNHSWEISGISSLTERDQYDRLMCIGQKYPDLKATSSFGATMDKIGVLQDDIAATQVLVNSNINAYNESLGSFPGLLIAKVFGYKPEKLIDEENIEKNKQLEKKKIDFSQYM